MRCTFPDLSQSDLALTESGEFDQGEKWWSRIVAGRTPDTKIIVLTYGIILEHKIA